MKLQLLMEPPEDDGKKTPAAAIPSASAGSVLKLETAVVNLLEKLSRKRMPLRDKLQRAFLGLLNELGRIPTYLELHLHNRENSKGYEQTFGSYVAFLHWAGCLTRDAVYAGAVADQRAEPVTPQEVAPFFHRYLTEKEHRKRIDFSYAESWLQWAYDEAGVSSLIARMPMTKLSGFRGSMTRFEDGV
ncbi:hypothetical protein AB6A23_03675 [Paenibacillus tarimensis]